MLGDNDVAMQIHQLQQMYESGADVDIGEAMHEWGQGVYNES